MMKFIKRKSKRQDPKLKEIDVSGKERVPFDKLDKDKFYYEANPFTAQYGLSKRQIKKESKLFKKELDNVVLIRMSLANGMFREFLISANSDSFRYKSGRYALDPEKKYYLIEREIWAYDFHEQLSIPYLRDYSLTPELEKLLSSALIDAESKPLSNKINVTEVRDAIKRSGIIDTQASMNPKSLKNLVDSEVARQVLLAARLPKIILIMLIVLFVILLLLFLNLIISGYASGLFDKIAEAFRR